MSKFYGPGAALGAAILVAALGANVAQQTKVEKAPVKSTSPASGHQMFKEYCAVCHGSDGKGNGPAASALKTPPPDLTLLSKKNGGKFPAEHVSNVLEMGSPAAAHGSSDMPIWGPLFKSMSKYDEALVKQRITNLTRYVESLQQK
jgi:mono/diheme cytochrome c family protein